LTLDEVINFVKKRGFWDMFRILSQCKNNRTEIHIFYQKLNEFSYYNSFLRIKSKLIERELIVIEKKSTKRIIRLTQKGKTVLERLIELDGLLKSWLIDSLSIFSLLSDKFRSDIDGFFVVIICKIFNFRFINWILKYTQLTKLSSFILFILFSYFSNACYNILLLIFNQKTI